MNKYTGTLNWLRLPILLAIIVAGLAALVALNQPAPAYAYISKLGLECNENPVTEGDTFRLHVTNDTGEESIYVTFNIDQTMKVYWNTEEGTADESDYRPLHNEGQASNRSQSDDGRMGRTFYTTDDVYTEETETYRVTATNASEDEEDEVPDSCEIEIEDDDGVGAIETTIVYPPTDGSGGYVEGDRILIQQRFNKQVVAHGGEITLGLDIGQGNEVVRREAQYTGIGSYTSNLLFEYYVTGEDIDLDGISIPASAYGGPGTIIEKWTVNEANPNYRGVDYGDGYKVHGRAFAKEAWISSSPANGEKYRAGEAIEISARFSRAVEVAEGEEPSMELRIGESDDSLRTASYNRGSGTRKLVFQYVVPPGLWDFDGIEVEPGFVDEDDTVHGLAAGGHITDVANGETIGITYKGLDDQSDHKVDSRPYVTGMSITSTPANGVAYRYRDTVDIDLTFDQEVEAVGIPMVAVWIGDDSDGRERRAKIMTRSQTDTLTFSYKISEYDLDNDGISVPEQTGFDSLGSVRMANGNSLVDDFIPGLTADAEHKVDGRVPYVTGSAFSSTPQDGQQTYRQGESIEVSLTFDKEVDVQGTPSIRLLIGEEDTRRDATYSNGAGTDTLVFAYEVQATDRDDDGASLMARSRYGIDGPDRVYEKGTENEVKATIEGIDDQIEHKVDGRPYVTNASIVSSPARKGIYRAGETVEFALVFDQEVEVEGSPSVRVAVGDEDSEREAIYLEGSGTTVLTFGYNVQAGDRDTDGVSLPAREDDGFGGDGSITASGTEVEAKGAIPGLGNQEGHEVAGRVRITSMEITSEPGDDGIYENGEVIEITIRFDDEVTVTGTTQIELEVGDDSRLAELVSTGAAGDDEDASDTDSEATTTGDVLLFAYTVQEGDEDADGVAIGENSLRLNGGSITGANGDDVNLDHEALAAEGHLVGAIPPAYESAETSEDGTEVVVSFTENVHVLPEVRILSAFAGVDIGIYLQTLVDVFVDDHRPYITGAEISGTELTLTLDTPITGGQTVEVAYDNVFAAEVSGLLVDDAGNALAPFSDHVVTNNSTLADNPNALWAMVSSHSLTVEKGGSSTYTMTLGSQPEEDVTVSLTVMPEGHLTASPQELTFTPENWDTPQIITLTAGDDDHGVNFWQEIIHTSATEDFVAGHLKVLVED